jgi:hypothetical protein
VTSPVLDTLATVGANDTHVIVGVRMPPAASLATALNCVVALTERLLVDGDTVTDATGTDATEISDESLAPPRSVATT